MTKPNSAGFTIIELLIVLVLIAILANIVIGTAFYAFDISRLGRTVADMRTVSNAIVKYERDVGSLPAGGLQPVAGVAALLAPSAGGSVPVEDGWGNALFYEPVLVAGLPTFRVYCYGKDGTPDGAVTGKWVDFFSDVVVESGTFVQTRW